MTPAVFSPLAAEGRAQAARAWRLMTVSLGLLGRLDEAKQALAHTLTLQPGLSRAHVERNTVFAGEADRSRFLLGL